jgi:uncharacterized protein involved in exopolysaccharide biosynthesis
MKTDAHDVATSEPPWADHEDADPGIGLVDLLTWLGQSKGMVAAVTLVAAFGSLGYALTLTPIFTARTTLLPPGSQQQSSSGAALAALGSLGGLAGGLGAKTPDELYVALLKSDSVQRSLAERFALMARYEAKTYESLRKTLPNYIRVTSDKKTGIITVEVDDKEPQFAAELANAHAGEIAKVLGRLAVSEAQVRRVFFEQQLKDTKENLVKAEQALRVVQEKSGVIVLDKQAEALIAGAAMVRGQIAEREVQLKVLRNSATEANPDVQRLSSELGALRGELARMESSRGGAAGSTVDMPVGKIPAAAIDYVRARRELKLQETLLESMIRQYEIAKLDEAKDAPLLQQVDVALPPDYKSKPSRAKLVLGSTLLALIAAMVVAIWRGYSAARAEGEDPQRQLARAALSRAWRLRK